MKKALVFLIVVAAIGAGCFFGWKKLKTQTPTRTVTRATTATVQLRDIHLVLDAAGDISPADQVSVRPEVNGKISLLPVDIGDQVKKGDMLFTLDDSDLQIERKSKLSEIEGAKLQLQKAERNYLRSEKLSSDKLISREAYDDAKTEYDVAKNSLQKLQQDLNLVDDHISKTRIQAPFDCTVLTRPVSIGQAVSGSGGFNSGTEVMTIANLTDMIILAHVNQADVAHLKIGQSVDVRVEAVAELKMKGTVDRIAPQATIRNNLKGFDVRITVHNIDKRVRPGMTANLSIPVISTKDTVAVPINAVFSEPNNDTKEIERFVYVKKDEALYERRPVFLGVSDNNYAEILEGVTTNEVVSLEEPPDGAEIKSATGKPLKKNKRGGKGGNRVAGSGGGRSGGGSGGTNRNSTASLVPK